MRFSSESGQSSVEAAVLLPVLFAVFGLLLQPSVLMYNRCIMQAAASEGCRLVATNTNDEASVRAYIERRLEAIPKIAIFHADDTWDIEWSGGEGDVVQVSIVNHAQPLPLFDIVAGLAGSMDEGGTIVQRVESSVSPIPSWAGQGYAPDTWIGTWR